jgi:hypothetical protein
VTVGGVVAFWIGGQAESVRISRDSLILVGFLDLLLDANRPAIVL